MFASSIAGIITGSTVATTAAIAILVTPPMQLRDTIAALGATFVIATIGTILVGDRRATTRVTFALARAHA